MAIHFDHCCCPHHHDDHHDDNRPQRHVHEVQGSVKIAEIPEDPHNHRFATVSGEAKFTGPTTHFHVIKFRTDFYEDHFHEFVGVTTETDDVGDRHVHFLQSTTKPREGHAHDFRLGTFINDPIGD